MAKEEKSVQARTTSIATVNQIEGLEGFTADLMIVPRLKIVQGLSAEASDTPVGSLVNNLTGEKLAKAGDDLIVVPLMMRRSRLMFYGIDDGGGIACQSFDMKNGDGEPGGSCASCKFKDWTKDDNKKDVAPVCNELISIAVITPDLEDLTPMVIGFMKTTYKTGKKWANMLAAKRVSPWNFQYAISTKFIEDGKKKYYVFNDIKPAGKTDESLIEMMRGAWDMLKDGFVVHEIDVDPAEEVESDDGVQEAEVVDTDSPEEDIDI